MAGAKQTFGPRAVSSWHITARKDAEVPAACWGCPVPASSDPIMLFRLASPIIFRTAESRTFTVFSMVPKYGDVEFKGVNKSSTSEDLKEDTAPEKAEELKPLLEKIKAALGDAVKDVRASSRLADSPSVIVSEEDEPSARMRQMMQAMGQNDMPDL